MNDLWHGRARVGTILSLGGGVQSSVLALMSARGDLPRVDCAVFADTRWEPAPLYAHLDWLEAEIAASPHPFPVHRVNAGNLRADVMRLRTNSKGKPYSPIPSHVEGRGIRKRQCTTQYKIRPIERLLRRLYQPRAGAEYVAQWMGISLDEIHRVKQTPTKWIRSVWPLVDARITRASCLGWFERRYPGRELAKSACIGCPYHSRAYWRALRRRHPDQFADALEVEQAMQAAEQRHGLARSFLHADSRPLGDAVPAPDAHQQQISLFDGADDECGAHCFA